MCYLVYCTLYSVHVHYVQALQPYPMLPIRLWKVPAPARPWRGSSLPAPTRPSATAWPNWRKCLKAWSFSDGAVVRAQAQWCRAASIRPPSRAWPIWRKCSKAGARSDWHWACKRNGAAQLLQGCPPQLEQSKIGEISFTHALLKSYKKPGRSKDFSLLGTLQYSLARPLQRLFYSFAKLKVLKNTVVRPYQLRMGSLSLGLYTDSLAKFKKFVCPDSDFEYLIRSWSAQKHQVPSGATLFHSCSLVKTLMCKSVLSEQLRLRHRSNAAIRSWR